MKLFLRLFRPARGNDKCQKGRMMGRFIQTGQEITLVTFIDYLAQRK